MVDIRIVLTVAGLVVALIIWLHNVLVKRKEAIIESLKEDVGRYKLQLDEAKNASPDILAERYKKKIDRYESELQELMAEGETKNAEIHEKADALERERANVAILTEQMQKASQILEDAEYYKEQFSCPHCGAELTTLAGDEEEYREYHCGNRSGPNGTYPCPEDPEFPKLEDYEFETRQLSSGKFFCNPKAKNRNAYKLSLQPQSGATEAEAKQNIIKNYERSLPERLRQAHR